ncbi:MAG: ester cyclase [Gammaproteobacteria bacterium]|jgi:predicted ester cyclase|nr:ester cyclase [Gammaproteobacteria bacterium]
MGIHKEQVKKFYRVLWDAHDNDQIPSVLHEDFAFRGSLGQEKRGHAGFAEYVDMVHDALGEYRCIIEELVSESNKVFAKMKFTGIHKGEFLGYSPTQQRVSWNSCALFTFRGDKVANLWVLGDLASLQKQLQENRT